MTWQAITLLFLGVIVASFIGAFIEVWWKSRHSYYIKSAKPRRNDPK